MTYFAFPSTIYDQPNNLLAVLGSWWAERYEASDQVLAVVAGKAQIEQQSMLDLMELVASISRFTVPIYHTDNWYPLYLRESQRNDSTTSFLKYDGSVRYDDGFRFDDPHVGPYHAFPKPADLVEAPLLLNRFVDPTFSQTSGLDFLLEDNVITFRHNPFQNPRVATRIIYDNGIPVDREAILWVHRGQFDWETVYKQFAYVFGIRLKSSTGYRQLMNAIYDAVVGGSTRQDVVTALSAMTGIPVVKEKQEVITDIVIERENLLIITDLSVYKFDPGATPTVIVGETVKRGQTLTDALRIDELNTGQIPNGLKALALGKGFINACFYSDLIFEDREVPIHVEENHVSGYTKIRWDLGGFPLDVDHFFDDLHNRGVVAALQPPDVCKEDQLMEYPQAPEAPFKLARRGTMAHWLDKRVRRVGETKAIHLPATINPLKFLVQNVLRNNAFIVRVKAREATTGVGLQNIGILRKVIPPHTAMILAIELSPVADKVNHSITERVSTFTGMTPLSDRVTTSIRDSRVTVRIVSGTCQ